MGHRVQMSVRPQVLNQEHRALVVDNLLSVHLIEFAVNVPDNLFAAALVDQLGGYAPSVGNSVVSGPSVVATRRSDLCQKRLSDGRAGCAEKPTSPLVDLCELSDFRFLNSQIFTVFVEFLESGIENSSEFGIVLTAPPVIYSEVSL